MRFIIRVASLGCISILTGGFAFADSFTINLTNNSDEVLNVCKEAVSGKNKAGDSNPCDINSSAERVAKVEGGGKDVIYVSSNDILLFFCNSTPITNINFSKDDPAKQCRYLVNGWADACHAQGFSCRAEANGIHVNLN